jgi:hypothetical protein
MVQRVSSSIHCMQIGYRASWRTCDGE